MDFRSLTSSSISSMISISEKHVSSRTPHLPKWLKMLNQISLYCLCGRSNGFYRWLQWGVCFVNFQQIEGFGKSVHVSIEIFLFLLIFQVRCRVRKISSSRSLLCLSCYNGEIQLKSKFGLGSLYLVLLLSCCLCRCYVIQIQFCIVFLLVKGCQIYFEMFYFYAELVVHISVVGLVNCRIYSPVVPVVTNGFFLSLRISELTHDSTK